MKKLTGILLALALILAPLSASALEMMTDSNMKDVTGQAGVSIALDDVVLFQDVGKTLYTDTDGLSAQYDADTTEVSSVDPFGGASVSISDQKQMTFINAIGAEAAATIGMANKYTTNYDYAGVTGRTFYGTYFDGGNYITTNMPTATEMHASLQGLTIDVGTCGLLTGAAQGSGAAASTQRVAGVILGLPNLEIVSSSSDKSIGIETTSDVQSATINHDMSFITISEEASTTAILDGYVEIAPH